MSVQISTTRLVTVFTHVLVWMMFAIVLFFYHPLFSGIEIPYQAWAEQTITLLLLVAAFYINATVLVPRFLLYNQFARYIALLIITITTIVFTNRLAGDILYHSPGFTNSAPMHKGGGPAKAPRGVPLKQRRPVDRPTIILIAMVLVTGTSLTLIQKWQKDKQERETLEKEKVRSELLFLKSQINPHFLFNTLNNIYALTQADAQAAGEAVHRLSRMLRYLLYETQNQQTMLHREIEFIKDYINLVQLRLTAAVKVTIDIPAQLADMPMVPMLLLPFVENAFKHGVSATRQSHIGIFIAQSGSELAITVKNSILNATGSHNKGNRAEPGSGIGLQNTRRRLALLYPGKYRLRINESNDPHEYIVHLILDLS